MGLIIGLIGASIIANTIGDKVIESKSAKARAEIEVEQERARAKIEAEKIRAKAQIKAAKIQSKAGLESVRIISGANITTTAMKTGFFASLFNRGSEAVEYIGNENTYESNQNLVYGNGNYAPYGVIDQGVIGPRQNRYRSIAYCSSCGAMKDEDAAFCKYCGQKL